MKIKTSELIGAALDWAVATVEFDKPAIHSGVVHAAEHYMPFSPATDWAQGGPIIERESIGVTQGNAEHDDWVASYSWVKPRMDIDDSVEGIGPTPLIAAMRCYVASRLGAEVDVPDELKS